MWVGEIEIFASSYWQGKGKNLSKEKFFQINKKIVYTLDILNLGSIAVNQNQLFSP